MKWVLCGKNDAAVRCLEFLVERGDEVWAVGNRGDDGRDGWQRSLRGAAERLGVPFDQPRRINHPQFVDRLAAFGANALISIQYDQILKAELLGKVGCPCLNLHFALLPRHRGVAPIAWAVLCGDAQAGVTLHHMIEDVDAGDVIAQRATRVGLQETAREVYEKVSNATVELFVECYPFSRPLLETRLAQDSSVASYHRDGDFDFSKRRVDWSRPASELHAWVRAMIFPPMQYPEVSLNGRVLSITRLNGALGNAVDAAPGTVLSVAPGGIEVAAADRSIRISGLLDPAQPEASPSEVMQFISVGEQLA